MRRQSSTNGVPTGKWMTMRRTDDSIKAPSFNKRSGKVLNCVRRCADEPKPTVCGARTHTAELFLCTSA